MDTGLLWTAAGSVAGVLAVALAGWQVRLQLTEHRHRNREVAGEERSLSGAGGLPVSAPLGLLPAEVRGRDVLLGELRGRLRRWRGRGCGAWVLAGMGGLGKSTVALEVARVARRRGWQVWWVSAADPGSLAGGMVEVLRQAGAPEPVVRMVRSGAPAAADRAWEFLGGIRGAGRRWLLVLDNADSPVVLAAEGALSPADHSGWLRPDPPGMLLVTSRVKDPGVWGRGVQVRELLPLDDDAGARVLADLALGAGDPGGTEARELNRRLGGLPLALHLAGSYLSSPFARWQTFGQYRAALDSPELPSALADLDQPGAQARITIQRTWDLSLKALAAEGRPQSFPLLSVLSCYAPVTSIPAGLLYAGPLAALLSRAMPDDGAGTGPVDGASAGHRLRDGLRGLFAVGLIEVRRDSRRAGALVVTVHPVVADVNRSRLLAGAEADLAAIADVAVGLTREFCRLHDSENPADWPDWRELAPHVAALLGWIAARLSPGTLAALASIGARVSDAVRRAGDPAAAEDLAQAGITAAARLGSKHPAVLAVRQMHLKAVGDQGRNSEAERRYRELLADQRESQGETHPETMATRHDLAWVTEYQGRYAEAAELCRALAADREKTLGADHPDTLSTRNMLARLTALQGWYSQGEQQCRDVLAAQMRVLGNEHPDTLVARHNLAWMIELQGRHAEAEQQQRELIADRTRIMGKDHPATLTTRRRLAWTLADQQRYAEAGQLLRQLITDLQLIQGEDHPATLSTRNVLALVTGLLGHPADAERQVRDVLADWARTGGTEQPNALAARHALGWMTLLQGKHAQAEPVLRQVLASRQRTIGDDNPDTQNTRTLLAEAIAAQGRHQEASSILKTALAHRERILGPDHPDTIQNHHDLTRTAARTATRASDTS